MTNKQIGQRIKSLLSQNKQLRQRIKELEKLKGLKEEVLTLNFLLSSSFFTIESQGIENRKLQQDLNRARRKRNYYNRMVRDLRQQIKSMEENK